MSHVIVTVLHSKGILLMVTSNLNCPIYFMSKGKGKAVPVL
jgi:hypothetical protein